MPTAKKEEEEVTEETLHPVAKFLLDAARAQREELVKLHTLIKSAEGQQAVVVRNATLTVLGEPWSDPDPDTHPFEGIETLGDLAEWLDRANKYGDALVKELRDARIKSASGSSADGKALRESFDDKTKELKASLITLSGDTIKPLGAPTVAYVKKACEELSIVKLSGSVSADGSVSKKKVQFGRTLADGTDRPMSEAQNTNGHMRQQFMKKFTDADLDIDGWRDLIRASNPAYSGNMDEYELTDKAGVRYWARYVSAE